MTGDPFNAHQYNHGAEAALGQAIKAIPRAVYLVIVDILNALDDLATEIWLSINSNL